MVGQLNLDYKKRKNRESHTVAGVSTIAADLLMLPAATMIQYICQQAGIQESEVMFIYACVGTVKIFDH